MLPEYGQHGQNTAPKGKEPQGPVQGKDRALLPCRGVPAPRTAGHSHGIGYGVLRPSWVRFPMRPTSIF